MSAYRAKPHMMVPDPQASRNGGSGGTKKQNMWLISRCERCLDGLITPCKEAGSCEELALWSGYMGRSHGAK